MSTIEYNVFNNTLMIDTSINEQLTEDDFKFMEDYNRIDFGDMFNQPVDNIPDNVREIQFGKHFNQKVDNLPSHLEEIYFGDDFNQPINNLPNTLKKIFLGTYFDQSVDYLPNSLETLEFCELSDFNQHLNNLPSNLKVLSINGNYQQDLDNLPDSIEILKIGVIQSGDRFYRFDDGWVIEKEEYFKKKIGKIPKNLKEFYIFSDYVHIKELRERLKDKLTIIYNIKVIQFLDFPQISYTNPQNIP